METVEEYLELSEADGEKRWSKEVVVDKESTSPLVKRAPRRTRCRILATATTGLAAKEEGEGSTKARKFVPRPAVPTLSKAEILLKQAEHISVRGNPCISIRHAANQPPVCAHCYTSFSGFCGIFTMPAGWSKKADTHTVSRMSAFWTTLYLATFALSRSRPKFVCIVFVLTDGLWQFSAWWPRQFCQNGPISLCVDLFLFICVYFVCFCFILHICCIIMSVVGWT